MVDLTDAAAAVVENASSVLITTSLFPQPSSNTESPDTLGIDYTSLCGPGNYPAVNSTTGSCDPCPAGVTLTTRDDFVLVKGILITLALQTGCR